MTYTERMIPERVRAMIGVVAVDYGVSISDILGKRRQARIVQARSRAVALLHGNGVHIAQIARYLNLNHSSVVYFLRKEQGLQPDPMWREVPVPDLSGEWAI